MSAIIEFFSSIGTILVTVVNTVVSFIKDLIFAIQLIAKFLANIPSYFSWLPVEIVSLIVALISIAAIFKLLGRGG